MVAEYSDGNSLKPSDATSHVNGCDVSSDETNHNSREISPNPAGEAKLESEASTNIENELQSPGFVVKIVPIMGETFDLQVNPTELIQELHQVLMDKEETCQFTCFSLHFNGQQMDNFAEVKSFKDLKQGSTIRVRQEPYTAREARAHVRHVRDLIWPQDKQEAYCGERGSSVSVLDTLLEETGVLSKMVTDGSFNSNQATSPKPSHKHFGTRSESPTGDVEGIKFLSEVVPGQFNPGNQPLLPMIPPESQSNLSLICISELSMSHWNPPPNPRKMKGDLLYIKVKTLEGLEVGVTAWTRGFYLNKITDTVFDPSPSEDPNTSLTLVELCSKISPAFKKNFSVAQKRRVNRNVLTRVPTSVQNWSWVVPSTQHYADELRSEDSWLQKLGYEEHILGQTRDWNEEIQSIREMPSKTRSDRLTKERAMYKTYSDFLSSAIRGAVAVVDGNMMPINPGENRKTHMYIYNNIFFSLGFDVKDHYIDFGGDAAAYVACNHDLKGVRVLNEADVEGLYTLGTAVVDYRGYRVACQTIMPGVLDKEQEESVVHGSIDFGKKIVSHDAYHPKLEKIAQELKCRAHVMCGDDKEKEHLVHVSTECKGIIGNDGRHYLLDLLRLFPPDVNFMPDLEDGHELVDSLKEKGFPRKHPHKLPQLRQELVEAFVDSRYLAFVSHATSMVLQQKNASTAAANSTSIENANETNSSEISAENDQSKHKELEDANEKVSNSTTNPASHIDLLQSSSLMKSAKDLEEIDLTTQKPSLMTQDTLSAFEKQLSQHHTIGASVLGGGDSANNDETNNNITDKSDHSSLVDFVKQIDASSGGAVIGATSSNNGATSIPEITEKILNENQKEIVKLSGEIAGSLAEDKFEIAFNLDAFSPKVSSRIPESSRKSLEAERQIVKDACKFLVHFMIPSFLKDCMQDVANVPLDSMQLTEALHTRGINMRYLSHISSLCQIQKSKHSIEVPNEDSVIASLDLLDRVVCQEMICRSAKHVFKRFMQTVDSHCLSDGVALFLNCFLGAYKEPKLQVLADEEESIRVLFKSAGTTNVLFGPPKKHKNKKKSQRAASGGSNVNNTNLGNNSNTATSPNATLSPINPESPTGSGVIGSWMHLSPHQLWRQIRNELKEYYYFDLKGDTIDEVLYNHGLIHCSLLRTFCPKVGVQIKLKNYNFLSTISPTFHHSDVLNLYPVVKHALPKAKEGIKLLNKGQHYIQQGLLRPGCELITESLHFLNHVYGPIHSDIALCLKLLAHLNYILGDPCEAISHQHKAIMMYERCIGYDSAQATCEYLRLSLYCFANEQPQSALYLLYRARYLTCVAVSEEHPEVATLDTNIGLVLHAMQKFDLAITFLHNALTLNERHCGRMSLKTALSHHLKACVASCQGDFRSALQFEKEAFNIYKSELGEDNEKTKESSELLKHLTSQAVALQRKINEFSKSSSTSFANAALPAFFITQPTHKGVLEMLNVINGFFFFHLKKDIDGEDEDTKNTADEGSGKEKEIATNGFEGDQNGHQSDSCSDVTANGVTTTTPTVEVTSFEEGSEKDQSGISGGSGGGGDDNCNISKVKQSINSDQSSLNQSDSSTCTTAVNVVAEPLD